MQKRKTNLYQSNSPDPFKISRSKISLYLECPQCFYLDAKLGISRPDMPGWSLNSAVDHLLKSEFDILRQSQIPHQLMVHHQIEAVPFWHPDFPFWRDDNNKKMGAWVVHEPTNLVVAGIIDDIWINTKNHELYIVDYKSTSSEYGISLDGKYKEGYKKQMEIYQWIFKQLGFNIAPVGYFLFANARKNRPGFHSKLEFDLSIIPYKGDNSWVERTLLSIKSVLDSDIIPESGPECQHCGYRQLINAQSPKIQTTLSY